jgi:hypothetical protein
MQCMKASSLIIVLVVICNSFSLSQSVTLVDENKTNSLDSINSDKLVNGFNPLLSSVVALPGKFEIYLFNTLDSKTSLRTNLSGIDTILKSKQFRFDHVLQINYGLKTKSRFNIGWEFYFSHLRNDKNINSSFLDVFRSRSTTGITKRYFHSLGPRIRWAPFAYLPELSFQSSIRFSPLRNNAIKQEFGVDRMLWQSQAIFYQHFLTFLTAQAQVGYGILFLNKNRQQFTHLFSYSTFLVLRSYREKIYLIGSVSYNEAREKTIGNGLKRNQYDFSLGPGLYWQLTKNLGMIATSDFPIAYDINSLTTEIIPNSWFKASVGLNLKVN